MQTFRRSQRALYASGGAVLSVLLGLAPASAQSGASAAPPGSIELQKGGVEVGFVGGSTLPVSWLRAHADRRITMGSIDLGRIVTHQRGGGPLAGNFEFLLEITPVVALRQSSYTYGLAASPLHMRWNFRPVGRLGVFAEASGGVIYTRQAVPASATSFNFLDQAGFGVRIAAGRRREWLAGYRFQHISNAGLSRPNPGANFNFVYAGFTFFR
ncbi:MAG TPA: acyloxyacyl hydrolase [Vicinamibacterales bacterium]|nr:acyloxyacyl hydrolase [Vicinamibacterales bacterium]